MGSDQSSQIATDTGLLEAEVRRLRDKFDVLRNSSARGGASADDITEDIFVTHFSSSHESLARMTFKAFDVRHTGRVSFRDFCVVVAILSKGNDDSKIDFAFSLYDHDNKGYISKADLIDAVSVFRHSAQRLMSELGVADPEMTSDREAADIMLQSMTLEDGLGGDSSSDNGAVAVPAAAGSSFNAKDGRVSKEQFRVFCHKHPEIFKQVQTSWHALQKAALWDWEQSERAPGARRPSMTPSDCTVS